LFCVRGNASDNAWACEFVEFLRAVHPSLAEALKMHTCGVMSHLIPNTT